VGALAALMTRVPEGVGLAVLVAAAALLRHRRDPTNKADGRPQVAATEPEATQHAAGDALRAAQEATRAVLESARCTALQPPSWAVGPAVKPTSRGGGSSSASCAADRLTSDRGDVPHVPAATAAGRRPSAIVSAALAALLSCHSALQEELLEVPSAAEPAAQPHALRGRSPWQQQQLQQSPRRELPRCERAVEAAAAGPSYAAGETTQSAAHPADPGGCGRTGGCFTMQQYRPRTVATASCPVTGARTGVAAVQALGNGTPAGTVQLSPGLPIGVWSGSHVTPRSSPLAAALEAAQGMTAASASAPTSVSSPRLDTWPVSLGASTELLRQLLDAVAAAAAAPQPLPAMSLQEQAQHWRLLGYAAGLAQRAVLAAGSGGRGFVGFLAEGLSATGRVAVDVVKAAREAQEAQEAARVSRPFANGA
jgi:hypothetical protein